MALLTQLRGKAGGNSCRFGTFINRKVARRFARHFFGSSQISSGFNFKRRIMASTNGMLARFSGMSDTFVSCLKRAGASAILFY